MRIYKIPMKKKYELTILTTLAMLALRKRSMQFTRIVIFVTKLVNRSFRLIRSRKIQVPCKFLFVQKQEHKNVKTKEPGINNKSRA